MTPLEWYRHRITVHQEKELAASDVGDELQAKAERENIGRYQELLKQHEG